jgi:hypothetical protein
LRTLGRQGVAELVDRCCAHARRLAEGLETIGFTVHNHVVLNQIVATIGSTDLTDAVRRRVEADGMAWFGPTHWAGRPALRFSVSSWATTAEDIDATLDAVAPRRRCASRRTGSPPYRSRRARPPWQEQTSAGQAGPFDRRPAPPPAGSGGGGAAAVPTICTTAPPTS